ncbi:protein-arginine deiminase (PAD) domain-containing protein [Hirsutella rhossiliensis]|uniref:Protein-arginine deiminase (PAD) domain-containing protein n=1 Tax=Hirsutella rhossiliensis TaxID=111463 RepID=A0A9P8SIE6_9HYPO|nr:protein-arginine deiminase (PAD) domain-containing protein [Hirsutella rhossiliensis]KAH0963811.1 protein-arginine deiminase (PAD) domain-containing protein [Hirsutella rhossiliensis]
MSTIANRSAETTTVGESSGATDDLRVTILVDTNRDGRKLRFDNVGAVQYLTGQWGDNADSLGSLETLPSYTHDGKSYPAGRIIMGLKLEETPAIGAFLQAQEEWEPFEVDV